MYKNSVSQARIKATLLNNKATLLNAKATLILIFILLSEN